MAEMLDNPPHMCCPGDCELLHEDGTPKTGTEGEAGDHHPDTDHR